MLNYQKKTHTPLTLFNPQPPQPSLHGSDLFASKAGEGATATGTIFFFRRVTDGWGLSSRGP